ncbi:MAG: flagellin [Rickettsiales bacterium]|nr:flagellin [Rickettsiales bacterium]
MVGINSNLAAASASRNLTSAGSVASSSIAKLSSGSRIIKASDDVAGLSIGTSISTTVKSLEIAKLNTEQARSVLQIADGALKQIGDILSRQKALAVQSNSGSLGNTQRAFLNQEFSALKSEIDRIVTTTSFNGITLLNGSIAGDASVQVSGPLNAGIIQDQDVSVSATVSSYNAVGTPGSSVTAVQSLASFDDTSVQQTGFGTFSAVYFNENGTGAESVVVQTIIGDKTYIGTITASGNGGNIAAATDVVFTANDGSGSAFTLRLAAGTGSINTSGAADTYLGTLTTDLSAVELQQTRVVSGLNSVTGTRLGGLTIASDVTIRGKTFDTTNNDFGTIGQFTAVAGAGSANYITVTLNGKTFSASDIGGANDTLAAADGTITLIGRDAIGADNNERLIISVANIGSNTVDLTDAEQVAELESALNQLFGVGNTGDAYTTVGTADSTYVSAVSVSEFNDASFQGEGFGTFEIVSFDENGSNAEDVVIRTQIGDKVYVSANLVASGNGGNIAAQDLEFTATDGSGSKFSLSLAAVTGALNTSTTAATYASNLTTALANVDIYQIRTVNSVTAANINDTVLDGLTASSVTIRSNNFDITNTDFGDIGNFVGVAGVGANNSLSVIVNGTTFSATDLGGANDILSSADQTITLIGRDAAGNDNNQRITIDITGLTGSINLENADEVKALTNALDSYFGVGASGSGGLSFQVGSALSDKIAISIKDVSTSKIYLDNDGVAQTLSIDTQAGAQTAVEALDNAISSVISRRADVGAAISRFEFASSNIEVSIANQDAARGSFLDANIAEESTKFATNQVKLQASVSVLAQANQIPQLLLRLVQQ